MLVDVASRYFDLNTTKLVTIRIFQLDLLKVKAKAKQKQIPYQTFLGAIIRDNVEGKRKIEL